MLLVFDFPEANSTHRRLRSISPATAMRLLRKLLTACTPPNPPSSIQRSGLCNSVRSLLNHGSSSWRGLVGRSARSGGFGPRRHTSFPRHSGQRIQSERYRHRCRRSHHVESPARRRAGQRAAPKGRGRPAQALGRKRLAALHPRSLSSSLSRRQGPYRNPRGRLPRSRPGTRTRRHLTPQCSGIGVSRSRSYLLAAELDIVRRLEGRMEGSMLHLALALLSALPPTSSSPVSVPCSLVPGSNGLVTSPNVRVYGLEAWRRHQSRTVSPQQGEAVVPPPMQCFILLPTGPSPTRPESAAALLGLVPSARSFSLGLTAFPPLEEPSAPVLAPSR